MKTGVDTCQARRIHKLHTKLLWTKLTFAKLAPEVQRSHNLQKFQSPRIVTPAGCLGCIGIELPRPPEELHHHMSQNDVGFSMLWFDGSSG